MAKPKSGNPKYKTAAHKAARAKVKPIVDAGQAYCAQPVCVMPSRWIAPGSAWDLGHDDSGTAYIGPTHATCNRVDGGKRRHRRAEPRRWVL